MSEAAQNGSTYHGLDLGELPRMQRALMDILKDGLPHARNELWEVLKPSGFRTVAFHMCMLRKKLPAGQDIVCVYRNKMYHYQWVRLLYSANDGRT